MYYILGKKVQGGEFNVNCYRKRKRKPRFRYP